MRMPDPILITGCARSGTSIVAGIISVCGVFGGKMSRGNRYNPKGMFENAEIRNKVVKPHLASMDVDPMGQDPLPEIDCLMECDDLRSRVEQIMKLHGHLGTQPWFYKGAKLCLIWPVWHKAFPNAKWVVVRRRDEDIIYSCICTGFMQAYNTLSGWQKWVDHHKARFNEMKASSIFMREVWPTKFMNGDFSEIELVVADLGLRWNDKAVRQLVEPALWKEEQWRE